MEKTLTQTPIYTSVIVLDDGQTWSGKGKILYLSANGYQRLLDGCDPSDLAGSDIVKEQRI